MKTTADNTQKPGMLRIARPNRARRSHAERRATTRRKVMEAVVASIAEVGYQKTTSAEIARRSGITWGGIQHHFGDKDGILMAALEESYNRFAEHLAEGPPDNADLATRVALFLERSWSHFSSAHYRSTFEILLNLPSDLDMSWRDDLLASWMKLWVRYFPESDPRSAQTGNLMHYTVSLLSGMAATRLLEGPSQRGREYELGLLADTLVRELSDS